jgi:hypothetical protein
MRKNNNFFIFILILLMISSCVGTIEEKNPENTKGATTSSESVAFGGLTKAVAVAHNKVELYWFPAAGNPEVLTYFIYINNSLNPAAIPATSLETTEAGLLTFTVDNLLTNTTYNFSVGVKNTFDNSTSDDNASLSATTFANITARFQGISSVEVPAGATGQNNLTVKWLPAQTDTPALALPYPQDPVGYEIRYINKLHGTGEDLSDLSNSFVVTKQYPTTITATTPASDLRTTTISGLTSGGTYYFMVRAIHKSFVDYGHIVSYKREMNNRYVEQTTTGVGGVFSLTSTLLNVAPPKSGSDQKDKVELKWYPATGSFDSYRVYWKRVADPDQTEVGVSAIAVAPYGLADELDEAYITTVIHPGGEKVNGDVDFGYFNVSADDTFALVKSLQSYGYYQIKIAACESIGCPVRIYSDMVTHRVVPSIAPFTGIKNIDHPRLPTELDRVYMLADPPVVTSGYIDKTEVWCYDSESDAFPVLLPNDGTPAVDGGSVCNNAALLTPSPVSLNSFSSFSEATIELSNPFSGSETVSSKRYCFAIVPTIDGDFSGGDVYDFPSYNGANTPPRDLSNAVVKCISPEIRVPSVENFEGRNLGCNVVVDDINVSWDLPTSGIYTNFVVFWKEKDENTFLFSDAVADIGTQAVYHNSIDTNSATFLNSSATSYTIADLKPGKNYHFGVLAFIDDADPTKRKFSEYNIRTDDCLVSLPKAEFKEITQVFAIGPKEDGLASFIGGVAPRLIETLDSSSISIEVNTDADGVTPSSVFSDRYGEINPSVANVFNGIYGSKDSDPATNGRFKYSNSGIVKFSFKDFVLTDGKSLMQHGIDNGELGATGAILGGAGAKANLKYGYKILRSDDGKVTWKDLTTDETAYQDSNNYGLVTAKEISYKVRNNQPDIDYNGVDFIDYSVVSGGVNPSNKLVARATVLYYKIVPIFDGQVLPFVDESSSDNIIKITLPPPNMALVDRRMANKTLCEEMGKSYLNGSGFPNQYYSCMYNGVGASGLSAPWLVGATVYDQGGDLLVDRYELGCNFTRGDSLNQQSIPDEVATYDFRGFASGGSAKYQGCQYTATGTIGPSNDPVANAAAFSSGSFEVRAGDCFGANISGRSANTCGAGKTSRIYYFTTPGLASNNACDDGGVSAIVGGYFDVYEIASSEYAEEVAQSEFAAVTYSRKRASGQSVRTAPSWRGTGNSNEEIIPYRDNNFTSTVGGVVPSSCYVNLPSVAGVDNGTDDAKKDGRFKPRWIPINYLETLQHQGGVNTNFSILDSTLNEVLSNQYLYESTTVAGNDNNAPSGVLTASTMGRINGDMPVGRVMTSNSSKLPPLTNLSQGTSHALCAQYEVEVGTYSSGSFNTLEASKEKRLLRRKEFVAASAWPRNYDFKMTSELERGEAEVDVVTGASSTDNSSCNSGNKDVGAGRSSSNLVVRDFINTRFPYTSYNNYAVTDDTLLITGSSIFDGDPADGTGTPSRNKHTQRCQSMFGIQDMVGNMEEHSSDQIYCDFTSDQMKFGAFPGDGNSITIANDSNVIVAGGKEVWVEQQADSGRCSMVQSGSLRSNISALSGVSFLPPYFSDSSVNGSVVTRAKTFDVGSVDDARSGDGYFLDFGLDNFGAPIKEYNTMGMVFDSTMLSNSTNGLSTGADPRRAPFFNPALGIPLECNGTGCDNSGDNRIASTEALLCRGCSNVMTFNATTLELVVPGSCSCDDPGALGISISDFPINNSQFYSEGISEKTQTGGFSYVRETNPSNVETFDYIDFTTGSPHVLVTAVSVSTDGAIAALDSNGVAVPDINTREHNWVVNRGQPMYMLNGGARDKVLNGRYSASVEGKTQGWQGTNPESGTRCVVKINVNGDY